MDYSVNRLISFINFAILDKYLKYPLWRIQVSLFDSAMILVVGFELTLYIELLEFIFFKSITSFVDSIGRSLNFLIANFQNSRIKAKSRRFKPFVQSGEYSARLDAYNNVLQAFFILFHNRSEYKGTFKFESVAELDEHIQTVEGFWQEVKESDYYR